MMDQTAYKLRELKGAIWHLEAELAKIKIIASELLGEASPGPGPLSTRGFGMQWDEGAQTVEGVFDGSHMAGPDGKKYLVPANYASKSRLVEGDQLKLTILTDGRFIYKQVRPVTRIRVVGTLTPGATEHEWTVVVKDRIYKVITASVTYFQGKPGDQAVILVPQDRASAWAAVENVLKPVPEGAVPAQSAEVPPVSVE